MHKLKTLIRLAAGIALLLALAFVVAQPSIRAAQNKSTAPIRGYYLTQGTYDGSQAVSACASGYHMASLWEIHEPSNLRYETALGANTEDSGWGPPTLPYMGWIRTGNSSSNDAYVLGAGNCNAWTSSAAADYGTAIFLPTDWTAAPIRSGPWVPLAGSCSNSVRVWCVQD